MGDYEFTFSLPTVEGEQSLQIVVTSGGNVGTAFNRAFRIAKFRFAKNKKPKVSPFNYMSVFMVKLPKGHGKRIQFPI
jgi:hypothetical protein